MGIGGLILATVGPYLVTRIGGAVISSMLIKFGVSRAAAGTIAPQLAGALAKLLKGGAAQLSPEEQAALDAYTQQTKSQGVPAHPGQNFRSL